MKIKAGFVTNSSSTTYILIDTNENHLEIYNELVNWHEKEPGGYFDHFEIIKIASFFPDQAKEFKIFNNYDKEVDWIQECTGVKYNKVGSRELYSKILNILDNGKTIHYVVVNDNMNLYEFIDSLKNIDNLYCSDDWYYELYPELEDYE